MKRLPVAAMMAVVIALLLLGGYSWLERRSDAEARALFESALVGWNVDASAYRETFRRSLPNQPTVRIWTRQMADGVEEIEVTEADRLVCRSFKKEGGSDWKSLGCLQR